MSDVLIHSFMPTNTLDSDHDSRDSWSLGTSSACSGQSNYSSLSSTLSSEYRDPSHSRLFQDYFGLSSLLNNVKISEPNNRNFRLSKDYSLLHNRNIGLTSKMQVSWDSDGSDPSTVLSPTIENASCNYDIFDINNNLINNRGAQVLPPSMRPSKVMREPSISRAYQQHIENWFPQPASLSKIPAFPTGQQANQRQSPSTNTLNPVIPSKPRPTARPRLTAEHSQQVCVFCRNNGENERFYSSHVLKDAEGRTTCPILRAYTCPICSANGDSSHTIKYCPMYQKSWPLHCSRPKSGITHHKIQTLNYLLRNPPTPRPMANFRVHLTEI